MTSVYSAVFIGLAQLSKIVSGLVLIKVIAFYLGPDGLGRLGHLISFGSFLAVLSGGGIQNGIVKYVSEYKDRAIRLVKFIELSISYSLYVSLSLLVLLCIFSRQLAEFIFGDVDLYWLIVLLGFVQVVMALNKIVAGVANGFKHTQIFATSQIIGNVGVLPVIWLLVYCYGYIGGVFAIYVGFLFVAIPSLYFYRRSLFWGLVKIRLKFRNGHKKLYGFSLMALVSAVTFPVVEIIIRQLIISKAGYVDAGVWQAAIKLSSAYVGFFSLFLAYYFLPSVSPCKVRSELRTLVLRYQMALGTVFAVSASVFYLFRDYFIGLLFSDEFLRLSDVIYIQLVGDFFKILAFVVGFVFVAKAVTWLYVAFEIFQGLLLVVLSFLIYGETPMFENIFIAYMWANVSFFVVSILTLSLMLKRPSRLAA